METLFAAVDCMSPDDVLSVCPFVSFSLRQQPLLLLSLRPPTPEPVQRHSLSLSCTQRQSKLKGSGLTLEHVSERMEEASRPLVVIVKFALLVVYF